MSHLAKHLLVEMWGLNDTFEDSSFVLDSLITAAKDGQFTVVNSMLKKFEPQGLTAIVMLSESHISIHTWPEKDYAALDIFTCGPNHPELVLAYILKALKPKHSLTKYIGRGEKLK